MQRFNTYCQKNTLNTANEVLRRFTTNFAKRLINKLVKARITIKWFRSEQDKARLQKQTK